MFGHASCYKAFAMNSLPGGILGSPQGMDNDAHIKQCLPATECRTTFISVFDLVVCQ